MLWPGSFFSGAPDPSLQPGGRSGTIRNFRIGMSGDHPDTFAMLRVAPVLMPVHVCFVALNAYPAIDPRVQGTFGGIETRSWLFARTLAKRPDVDVSFVVRHPRPLRQSEYDGVRMHLLRDRLYFVRDSLVSRLEWSASFPWVQLRHPRLSDAIYLPLVALRKALVRRPQPMSPAAPFPDIPADLFLTFGVQGNSATVIASAHATGRPAVLFLASLGDLDERYVTEPDFVNEYRDSARVCRWTIEQADHIICQTAEQQELLKNRFGREGLLVENPLDLEAWDRGLTAPVPEALEKQLPDRYALWIGRSDRDDKRPLVFLEVAARCPNVPFLMILNPRDDVIDHQVRSTAPDNVTIITSVPFEQMPAVFRRASLLVNTSRNEGLANTFLQAAASGVPIASLEVGEEFFQASHAGGCTHGDREVLAAWIKTCHEAGGRNAQGQSDQGCELEGWNAKAARRYIEQVHSAEGQTNRLAELLKQIATEHRTR